jgi:hypothetical protein
MLRVVSRYADAYQDLISERINFRFMQNNYCKANNSLSIDVQNIIDELDNE